MCKFDAVHSRRRLPAQHCGYSFVNVYRLTPNGDLDVTGVPVPCYVPLRALPRSQRVVLDRNHPEVEGYPIARVIDLYM